ncbi:MAG: hypothetical protein RL358_425 [Pseudomonadota bacterium]|jgi:hypothetical protein
MIKIHKLTLLALALWVVTIVVLAWVFVHGNTRSGTDGRTAIVLKSTERNLILAEMRTFLSSTQGILEGANQGNRDLVFQAASASAMPETDDEKLVLMAKLPMDFKMLGMSVRSDMAAIAAAAKSTTPTPEILQMTANTLTKCVACHATWQLQSNP